MDVDELAARRQARRKKSKWKRPRRIFSLWARLGMAGAVIILSVLLSMNLIAKAVRPYREAGLQKSQLLTTRQQSEALETENAALIRRIAYLKTPQGIASEARKMGYLKPGEIPMVVEADVSPGDASAELSAPKQLPSRGGAFSRFWRHLTGN